MPTSDFTAKLLEMEEMIISDLTSSNTGIHIHFSSSQSLYLPSLPRADNKFMIIVLPLLKIFLSWANRLFFIIGNGVITVLIAASIFMNLFLWLQNIVARLHGSFLCDLSTFRTAERSLCRQIAAAIGFLHLSQT